MRRRRQGRKSPGNNSSAQEAAAWPGAACGTGPAERAAVQASSPAQSPAWPRSWSNKGVGEARCGNRLFLRPWRLKTSEDFRGFSLSSQGETLQPPSTPQAPHAPHPTPHSDLAQRSQKSKHMSELGSIFNKERKTKPEGT